MAYNIVQLGCKDRSWCNERTL